MKNSMYVIFSLFSLIVFSCGNGTEIDEIIETKNFVFIPNDTTSLEKGDFKILSLGDSYTIGQSVCATCNFPSQLVSSLLTKTANDSTFPLKIIAQTGWTTSNLITAINSENINSDYNLVTLLIGVNNQYQNKPFSIYEEEFPKLVNIATNSVKGDKRKVIVLSIPDYAFTPFGQGNSTISNEIKKYNDFAENYCKENSITFLNITDITQSGLINTSLVASDGLHPSKIAYSKFVERLLPLALEKLNHQ